MKNIIVPLTVLISLTVSVNASAKSRYEKDYEQMQKFRLGSFTIDMVNELTPADTQTSNGIDLLYFDNATIQTLPFKGGFFPEMTVLTNKEHTTATYSVQFKDQSTCISKVGQKELKPLYYRGYHSRAVKKAPTDKVWELYVNKMRSKQEQINRDQFQLVTNGAYAKAYFNPLYPDNAGTFEKPTRGDIFIEMECKENGSMSITFIDVSKHSALNQ
ncbi:hypothetical protein [Vibrio parahaemolyticus]|uniref:hypothetical protein n=1 Tax=Vibrio parahaemolyticus TaxID=670 RepID=UPI002B21A5BC|nr:hypothetical protein [Vibrio parahaemolyticus]MEA5347442.1 hypothetical protein [Vibrio parahaemolyticus]